VNTSDLPKLHFPIPQSVAELLDSSGSSAGYHAVSSYLACPEKSRLRASGLRRKQRNIDLDPNVMVELNPMGYGTLIHCLLGTRIVYGHDAAEALLGRREAAPYQTFDGQWSKPLGLLEPDRAKALLALRTYDATHPLNGDPFRYIGVESEVKADVALPGQPTMIRTVRYDGVVQQDDPVRGKVVLSLEHKTAARGGNMKEYTGQAMVQVTLWNQCPALVEKYGPMVGVIFDVIVKSIMPKCERLPPRYVTKAQQQRALEYLRLPETVKYPINADGSYPRMLHTCFDRYGACDYVDLCLEGARGEYEVPVKINKPAESGEEKP